MDVKSPKPNAIQSDQAYSSLITDRFYMDKRRDPLYLNDVRWLKRYFIGRLTDEGPSTRNKQRQAYLYRHTKTGWQCHFFVILCSITHYTTVQSQ